MFTLMMYIYTNCSFLHLSTPFGSTVLHLSVLRYALRVSASEYAAYYFHIRSLTLLIDLAEGKSSSGDRSRSRDFHTAAVTASINVTSNAANNVTAANTSTSTNNGGSVNANLGTAKPAQRSKTFDNLASLYGMKSVMSIDALHLHDTSHTHHSSGSSSSGSSDSHIENSCNYENNNMDAAYAGGTDSSSSSSSSS